MFYIYSDSTSMCKLVPAFLISAYFFQLEVRLSPAEFPAVAGRQQRSPRGGGVLPGPCPADGHPHRQPVADRVRLRAGVVAHVDVPDGAEGQERQHRLHRLVRSRLRHHLVLQRQANRQRSGKSHTTVVYCTVYSSILSHTY